MNPMTEEEILAEKAYRYDERLAILCGPFPANPEDRSMAKADADAWEKAYRAENNVSK